jgi:hypothetical protein
MAIPFTRQKGQQADHHARKNRDDDTVTVLLQLEHNSYPAQASVMLKLRAG